MQTSPSVHPDAEWRLRLHEAALEQQRDQLGAVLAFALAALRNLFLLNGGAVVALLAFYGDALAGAAASPLRQAAVVAGLAWFVGGLIAAFLACGGAFLGQLAFAEGDGASALRRARALRLMALLLAAASLGCFALGAFAALGALG